MLGFFLHKKSIFFQKNFINHQKSKIFSDFMHSFVSKKNNNLKF